MAKTEEAVTPPSNWRNRRVQRTLLIALAISTLISASLYFHLWTFRSSLPSLSSGVVSPPTPDDDDDDHHQRESTSTYIPSSPYQPPTPPSPLPLSPAPPPQPLSPPHPSSSSSPLSPHPSPSSSPLSPHPSTSSTPPTTAIDPTRMALLIETRPIPHLPALLAHFISILPPTWQFRFVGSEEAIDFVSSSSALTQHTESGKLRHTLLPAKYEMKNGEEISVSLTDLSFYKDFVAPAEWLLIFQSDSMICAASNTSIEDWVQKNYTYIGAPWSMEHRFGGNGGLSLRHVPDHIALLEQETRAPGTAWEDVWLTQHLANKDPDGSHTPGPEISRQFSVESVWAERPFGYHLRGSGKQLDMAIWGNVTRKQAILDYCPEIKIILN